jgi:hypothetical protein
MEWLGEVQLGGGAVERLWRVSLTANGINADISGMRHTDSAPCESRCHCFDGLWVVGWR